MPMNENEEIPIEIRLDAEQASLNLIPFKSKKVYDIEYKNFNDWKEKKGVAGVNEEVLLAYFFNARKQCAASSLWKKYSMLKSTLKVYNKIDISKYGKLVAYLKNESRSYKPKKAKILEKHHIEQFLKEAPDTEYLMKKVALLMGIAGACRCNELTNLSIDAIEDKGSYLFVTIADTKTYVPRSFTMIQEGYPVNALELYRKYVALRPVDTCHRRLFVKYASGKCTKQPVGINTLSRIPASIASYLKLPDPERFTGHSLRRSSATLLANGGGDLLSVKRLGGWKSSHTAEGYIDDCVNTKIGIAKKIQGVVNEVLPSTSTASPNVVNGISVSAASSSEFSFTINVNVKLQN